MYVGVFLLLGDIMSNQYITEPATNGKVRLCVFGCARSGSSCSEVAYAAPSALRAR